MNKVTKQKKKNNNIKSGIGIIWRYASQYKKSLYLMIFLSFIMSFLVAAYPYLLGRFFDALSNSAETGTVDQVVWVILLIAIGSKILESAVEYCNERVSRPLGVKLANWYPAYFFEKIIAYPISFISNTKRGSIHSVYSRASSGLVEIIAFYAKDIGVDIMSVFLGLGFVFYMNIQLGGILLVGVFIYTVLNIRIMPKIDKLSRDVNKTSNKANSMLHETIDSFTEIKRSHTEQMEVKKIYEMFTGPLFKVNLAFQMMWVNTLVSRHLVITLTQGSILGFSALLVANGQLSVGELVSINIYSLSTFVPFRRLSNMWLYLVETIVKVHEAEQMIGKKPENYIPKGAKKLRDIQGDVEFRNVEFAYEKKSGPVLRGIDLRAQAGQKVALVGKSGSGKTTSVELIGALYFPQKGKVMIDGIPTDKLHLDELRKNIAYVSQDVMLFADTIENNIRYAKPNASKDEVIAVAKLAHCDEFITQFPKGYKTKIGERGVKLSGGQKQRIAIAQAILRDPKILILDEPTSALDIESEKFINESLEHLMKGRTTFIIAHRLSTVREADNIFVFEDGQIIESGRHDELLDQDGRYAHLYQMYLGMD